MEGVWVATSLRFLSRAIFASLPGVVLPFLFGPLTLHTLMVLAGMAPGPPLQLEEARGSACSRHLCSIKTAGGATTLGALLSAKGHLLVSAEFLSGMRGDAAGRYLECEFTSLPIQGERAAATLHVLHIFEAFRDVALVRLEVHRRVAQQNGIDADGDAGWWLAAFGLVPLRRSALPALPCEATALDLRWLRPTQCLVAGAVNSRELQGRPVLLECRHTRADDLGSICLGASADDDRLVLLGLTFACTSPRLTTHTVVLPYISVALAGVALLPLWAVIDGGDDEAVRFVLLPRLKHLDEVWRARAAKGVKALVWSVESAALRKPLRIGARSAL
eukprot:NODE_11130_length_1306_cov_2.771841.p1 GENE.NODE_11130_length_1306_cov_2.771841~~NODE_11130_length_1306_cov_2.771841.p1  ORF type:complete len:333 (-),score=75.34 NODE_11130_length_1306_cov_2.771841:217-1215(-)